MPRAALTLPLQAQSFFGLFCEGCGSPMCEREALYALALGEEEATLCLDCLAEAEETPATELQQTLSAYIQGRACFKKVWDASTPTMPCPLGGGCVCGVPCVRDAAEGEKRFAPPIGRGDDATD